MTTSLLADSADYRLLYGQAMPLYRRLADAGDWDAARRLAGLLAAQGRVDDAIELLRARAGTGDWDAAGWLAELLAEQGRVDELAREVDAGTPTAVTS